MAQLEIGQKITYVLLPKDQPIDPDHEYHGIITALLPPYIKVVLTDPGYEGLEEWIDEKQITNVEEQNPLQ
jgi:hypothetical protein